MLGLHHLLLAVDLLSLGWVHGSPIRARDVLSS